MLIVATENIPADELEVGDILVRYPRDGINPWEGRRRVAGVKIDEAGVHVDLRFPGTLCGDVCEASPVMCPHYGQGGRMTDTMRGTLNVTVVVRGNRSLAP